MAAYLIVDIDIIDPVRYEVYKDLAAPTLALYGGKYLARGGEVESLEGTWNMGRIVVVEFPSAERAREWWNSDAYKAAKKLRQSTARTNMILVQGI